MTNKNLSNLIIASILIALLAVIVEDSYTGLADVLYEIAGWGVIVFGIWGAIVLRKQND